jgi:hypothetical protein
MSRTAIVIVAAALAFAAVTGTIALTKTVRLGRSATSGSASSALIARRTAQLDAFEASLNAQLRQKPPAVPKLPAAQPATRTVPQRVVYVRPAPIVVHKHRAGGEVEGSDHEGGGDD